MQKAQESVSSSSRCIGCGILLTASNTPAPSPSPGLSRLCNGCVQKAKEQKVKKPVAVSAGMRSLQAAAEGSAPARNDESTEKSTATREKGKIKGLTAEAPLSAMEKIRLEEKAKAIETRNSGFSSFSFLL